MRKLSLFRSIPVVIAATVIAALTVPASAYTTFDTTASWNGSRIAQPFGNPNYAATFGQTFVAPADAILQNFTFFLKGSTTLQVQAQVYAWSGSLIGGNSPQGAIGPALFTSPPITIAPTGIAFAPVSINTGGTPLSPGAHYIALLTISGPNPTDYTNSNGTDVWGLAAASHVPNDGGGGFNFDNNGNNFAALTGLAWDDYADYGDLVWKASFNSGLSDPPEPGSIIVYQKFQRGWVNVDAGQLGAAVQPRSLIELGATCPTDDTTCGVEKKVVRVNFHWVCPPQPDNAGAQFAATGGGVCVENDFFVNVTVNGKVWFSPEGGATSGDLPGQIVPQAPCNRGYLIGFVTNIGELEGNNTAVFANGDRPIRFDGLIGDAVMRNTPQDLQAFEAVTIQANPNTPEETALTGGTAGPDNTGVGTLVLNGGAGNYEMVTGQLSGDVRYDSDINPPFADTALILLTLDVKSNQKNLPTYVNLNFFNAQQRAFSEALSFICWGQINITTIDASLTQEGIGSSRGLFITSQAYSAPIANGGQSSNADGSVTLLGAVQVTEGRIPGPLNATRSYTVPVFNNSKPIATEYFY